MDNQVLKQELAIFFKKLVAIDAVHSQQKLIERLEASAIRVEYESKNGPYDTFFVDFYPVLEEVFTLQNEKADFVIVDFLERCHERKTLLLSPKPDEQSSISVTWKNYLLSNPVSELLLKYLCSLYKHKSFENYIKLTRLILNLFIENFGSLTTNLISKIIYAYFIAHFDLMRIDATKSSKYLQTATQEIIFYTLKRLQLASTTTSCKFIKVTKSTVFTIEKQKIKPGKFQSGNVMVKCIKTTENVPDIQLYSRHVIDFLINKVPRLHEDQKKSERPISMASLRFDLAQHPGFSSQTLKGQFGNCFICQNPSNYYHMDEHLPLCSIPCKLELERLLISIQNPKSHADFVMISENRSANTILTYFYNLALKKTETSFETSPFLNYLFDLVIYFLKHAPCAFFIDTKNAQLLSLLLHKIVFEKLASNETNYFEKSLEILWVIIMKAFENFFDEIHWVVSKVILKSLTKENMPFLKKIRFLRFVGKLLCNPSVLAKFILNFDLNVHYEQLGAKLFLVCVRSSQLLYLTKNMSLSEEEKGIFRGEAIAILEEIVLRYNQVFAIVRNELQNLTGDQEKSTHNHEIEEDQKMSKFGDDSAIQEAVKVPSENIVEDFINIDESDASDSEENTQRLQPGLMADLSKMHHKLTQKCFNSEDLTLFATKLDELETKRQNFEIVLANFRDGSQDSNLLTQELAEFHPALSLPKKLALLIYHHRKISKTAAGEFFGRDDPLSRDTFFELICLMNIGRERIDIVFRNLLKYITMPYFSEKINRILLLFGEAYNKNSSNIVSKDCAYGLVYLMIMLQSELHNPLVQEKMTLKQFLSLASKIPDFAQFYNESIAKEIFNSVSEKPLDWSDKPRHEKRMIRTQSRNSRSWFNGFFREPEVAVENPLKKMLAVDKRQIFGDAKVKKFKCHHEQYIILRRFFKSDNSSVLTVNLLMTFSNQDEQQFATFAKLVDRLGKMLVNLEEEDSLLQLLLGLVKNSEISSANARHVFTANNIFAVLALFKICISHYDYISPMFGPRLYSFMKSFERFTVDEWHDDPYLSQNAHELRKAHAVDLYWKLKAKFGKGSQDK